MNYKLALSLSFLCIFSVNVQAGIRRDIIEQFRGLPKKSKAALIKVIAKDFEIYQSTQDLKKNEKKLNTEEAKAAKEKKYALYRERHDLIMKLDPTAARALYDNVYSKKIELFDKARKVKYMMILVNGLTQA